MLAPLSVSIPPWKPRAGVSLSSAASSSITVVSPRRVRRSTSSRRRRVIRDLRWARCSQPDCVYMASRRRRGGGPLDERVRVDARVVERAPGVTVLALEKRDVAPNAAVDHPGVASTRAFAQGDSVNDDRVFPQGAEARSRGQSRESRADHDDIGGSRKLATPQALGTRCRPTRAASRGNPRRVARRACRADQRATRCS